MNAPVNDFNAVRIDPDFKAQLPPLAGDEFAQLEANILADGCRDPLVLWGNTIVDGHNRYAICRKHGLAFTTVQMEFADREAAADWIDANAIGKRNLSPDALKLALGRRYNRAKKAHGGDRKSDQSSPQNDGLKTADKIAAETGVSRATVERAGAAAAALEDEPELAAAVMAGELKLGAAAEVAALPAEEKASVINADDKKEAAEAAVKKVRGTQGTGDNEWYTPDHLLDKARAVLGGFDLDPASNDLAQEKIRATKYFTAEDDGLAQEWHGRVWLNPPYAQPLIGQFMERLRDEVTVGRCKSAIALTHNYTDTKWFQDTAAIADAICFTRGRVKFYAPSGAIAAPTQGQAFFYFGTDVDAFVREFSDVGFVVEVRHGL
jgi:phage N-6-adenine-methyltransferase